MPTLSVTNPTLLDVANRTDPDGTIADIVEILNQTSEILDDMSWVEGNLPTGHKTTVRSGLPTPTWRMLNYGVQPAKSRTVQITDTCGMLESYAEIDKALADLNNNTAEWRLSEERSFIEGMHQEVAETLFYGNEGDAPAEFTGFAPRFNDLSAENADNIIDAEGTGSDNASIWLIGWSPNTCHGIIPKGSKAGLQMEDKGVVTIEDADGSGGRMEAYRSHYRWDVGLTLRDWRYVVRICNIDRSDLSLTYTSGAFSSGAHLPNLMTKALGLLPNLGNVRPAFYMDRDMRITVSQQIAAAAQNSTLTEENVGGRLRMAFHGVPMRVVDALASDEARIT